MGLVWLPRNLEVELSVDLAGGAPFRPTPQVQLGHGTKPAGAALFLRFVQKRCGFDVVFRPWALRLFVCLCPSVFICGHALEPSVHTTHSLDSRNKMC